MSEARIDVPLPEDWADDDDLEPSVVDLNLDAINSMLGGLSRLRARIGELVDLDVAEARRRRMRLDALLYRPRQRAQMLEDTIVAFALRAWREEKRSRFVLPHGTIKLNQCQPSIAADESNRELIGWLEAQPSAADCVDFVPKVRMKATRLMLEALEKNGVVKRCICSDEDAQMLEAGEQWLHPLPPGTEGRWMVVETGELVPGLTWSPNGDDGSGRNVQVDL